MRPLNLNSLPIFALALSSPLLVAGCPPQGSTPCPYAELQASDPEPGGSVHWTFGEDADGGAPEDTRSIRGGRGQSPYPVFFNDSSGRLPLDEWVALRLETATGDVLVTARLGDPRSWEVGPRSVPATFESYDGPDGQVALSFPDPTCEFPCTCSAYINSLEMEVLQADGESRPFPEVISSDFHRTYRLQLDATDITGYRGSGDSRTACPATLSVAFDLVFELEADHFVIRPDATCEDGTPL